MDEAMEPKKGARLEKKNCLTDQSLVIALGGEGGGVGWGKEGVLRKGLYIYSYCHKNIAEPYGVSGKFYRNTSKILQTLLPPEHK